MRSCAVLSFCKVLRSGIGFGLVLSAPKRTCALSTHAAYRRAMYRETPQGLPEVVSGILQQILGKVWQRLKQPREVARLGGQIGASRICFGVYSANAGGGLAAYEGHAREVAQLCGQLEVRCVDVERGASCRG